MIAADLALELSRKFQYIGELEEARHHSFRSDPEPDESHPWRQELSHETFRRNRYTDITPWAQTRIRLKVSPGTPDYINASPISLLRSNGLHELQYIATQGPKQNGVDHFWQMVWHECGDVAVVVMLTKLSEGMKEKCFPYYPTSDEQASRLNRARQTTPAASRTISPPSRTSTSPRVSASDLSTATQPTIQLALTSDDGEEISGSVTLIDSTWDEASQAMVRKLSLVRGDESRIVYHLFFSGWPDFGVPQGRDRAALMNLIRLSNAKNDNEQEKSPRVVHCSAGVGRTGTFIALEHLLGELDQGAYDSLDELAKQESDHRPSGELAEKMSTWPDPIFDAVARLREQRPVMVQSQVQFAFIYETVAEEWLKRKKRLLEEKKLMAEPSPKSARLSRGLKKMLHLGREKPASASSDTNTQG